MPVGADSLVQDTLIMEEVQPVRAFPADWLALFGEANPYAADAWAKGVGELQPGAGRVFAERGALSRFAVRGGYRLQGEVSIPRIEVQVPPAVGSAALGVLLLFFLLFVLLRRHYIAYVHRYVNSRFFSVSSVRTAETVALSSVWYRAGGDVAWSMLVGFLIWWGLWLQSCLRVNAEEMLLVLLTCMLGSLVFTGFRYAVFWVSEYLSSERGLRSGLWENGQMPMRAFWPLLLVGSFSSVYAVQPLQWVLLLVSLGLVGVCWVLRFYRLWLAYRWHGYGRLYFFLYLCGVEILLPLLAVRWSARYM